MNVAKFVEQISDDFQSTFTVVNDDMIANMMGLPGDFENLTRIIHKYMPGASVEFTKSDKLGEDSKYDIYVVFVRPQAAQASKGEE
jgi:hypothetical protein